MPTTITTRLRHGILLLAMGALLFLGAAVSAETCEDADAARWLVEFAPYFVGRKQRDLVLVENFGQSPLDVCVQALDPLSGQPLDKRMTTVDGGRGGLIRITTTIPEPHASRLRVLLFPLQNTDCGVTDPCTPRVTRLLVTDKRDTVLQVHGHLQPMESNQER
jgi:hypothetical protein